MIGRRATVTGRLRHSPRFGRLFVHECGGIGDGLQAVDRYRLPGHLAEPIRACLYALQRPIYLLERLPIEVCVIDCLFAVVEQAGLVALIADAFLVTHGLLDVSLACRDAGLIYRGR